MTVLAWIAALAMLSATAGCGGERAGGGHPDAAPSNAPAAPADSLALRTRAGVEIWFTAARTARDSAGRPCIERVMEIRGAGKSIPIPLLYTGEPPRVVDDSTIEADLWLNCHRGNRYRVNLRTGQPVRAR
jgi:hypothetical protein